MAEQDAAERAWEKHKETHVPGRPGGRACFLAGWGAQEAEVAALAADGVAALWILRLWIIAMRLGQKLEEEALCLLGCTCRAGTICYLHDPAMDKIIEAHWTDAKQIERWTKARALSAALREALREQP